MWSTLHTFGNSLRQRIQFQVGTELSTKVRRRTFSVRSLGCIATACLLLFLALSLPSEGSAQKRIPSRTPKSNKNKPVDELSKLREEFVNATREYKGHLEKLGASYEKDVRQAEDVRNKAKEVFEQGLISGRDFEATERGVSEAKAKVAEVNQRIVSADTQIAQTLLEAETEKTLARSRPLARGAMMRTASFIRYNGGAIWSLSDSWKVQRFFLDAFRKPLPVTVFGQGSIHDRWRLDHHNAMDVSLHPDGSEGQALMSFLHNNGIPFLAFWGAIPGTATGPHIHIGRPSHKY
ncbi:MAG: TolC family protein [Pyrinomonadaceae bacterium]